MRRLPDAVQLALGLGLIAALTAFKLTLGESVSVIDFLFIPVVGVGWFASRRWCGYAVAAVAAVDTMVLGVVAAPYASPGVAIAAGTARFGLYLMILLLLGMMRRERATHQHAAATDLQTGAANARAFRAAAHDEVARAREHGYEISLAYFDLDDFKTINDRLGHAEGDHVLFEVSHVMRSVVRGRDTVGRIGGDEFAILMPETGADAARVAVDRVRGHLARLRTSDGSPIGCSIGLVTFRRPPASLKELIDAGDDYMYEAKHQGKDRVVSVELGTGSALVPRFAP
jgi:diguanylate cyclase (GGDEF)-like protein